MNTPPRSVLKSLPATTTGPRIAEPAPGGSGSGAPKVVAEGVRVAVLPDPRTVTGIRPGLSVRGLERRGFPVADWLCTCGHHERARGRRAVIELNTRASVQRCPHDMPTESRRSAA